MLTGRLCSRCIVIIGLGGLGSYVMLRRYDSSCICTTLRSLTPNHSSKLTHHCTHPNAYNTTNTHTPIIEHPNNPSTMTATSVFTAIAGVLALVGAYFYFFGIDPETKRQLENQALKTMGEASYP